jgi:hypothetical protein
MFKIFIYYLIFIPTDAGDAVSAKPYGEIDGDSKGDAVEKVDGEVNNDLPQKRVEEVTDLQKVEGQILDPEKELTSKPLILVGLSIVVERYKNVIL